MSAHFSPIMIDGLLVLPETRLMRFLSGELDGFASYSENIAPAEWSKARAGDPCRHGDTLIDRADRWNWNFAPFRSGPQRNDASPGDFLMMDGALRRRCRNPIETQKWSAAVPEKFASGVEDNAAKKMIGLLNERLADAIDLTNSVKQAHWNIKGPSFIGIHLLLDEVADRLREHADTIAERCVVLGGIAKGTVHDAASNTSLKPYPDEIHDQKDHVRELTARFKDFGAKCREAIDTADEAGDMDTSDLFTEVSRAIDKDAWFIGAHNDK